MIPIARNGAASAYMNRLTVSKCSDWRGTAVENDPNGVFNFSVRASGLRQVQNNTIRGRPRYAMEMALYLNLFVRANESSICLDMQSI